MNVQETLAWVQAGEILISAGVGAIDTIRGWIKARHGQLTEAELDAICDAIIVGATRHKRLALADAGMS